MWTVVAVSLSACLSVRPTVRVAAVLSFCQLIDCQRLRMAFINSHFCIIIMRKQHSARLAYKFPLTDRGGQWNRDRELVLNFILFLYAKMKQKADTVAVRI